MSGTYTLTCRKFIEGCSKSGIGKNGKDDISPALLCDGADFCVRHIQTGENVIVDYVQNAESVPMSTEKLGENKTLLVISEALTGLPVARVMTDEDGKSITTVFEQKVS